MWSVWPNAWVFVYKLSGCGFKSRCSQLNNRWCLYIEHFTSFNIILEIHFSFIFTCSYTRHLYINIIFYNNILSLQKHFICRYTQNIKILLGFLRVFQFWKKNNKRFALKLAEDTKRFQRFWVEKPFFRLEIDTLCGAYMRPSYTTPNITTKTNYFENLNKTLLQYKYKSDVLIMGDLNAKTGNEDAFYMKSV